MLGNLVMSVKRSDTGDLVDTVASLSLVDDPVYLDSVYIWLLRPLTLLSEMTSFFSVLHCRRILLSGREAQMGA